MQRQVPCERELATIFLALHAIHEDVNRIDASQLGHRSLFRDVDTYLESSHELEELGGAIRASLAEAVEVRKRCGVGVGRSPHWSGVMHYGEALSSYVDRLRNLCYEAWRVRSLGGSYPRDQYRRDLRRITDWKINADDQSSLLLSLLERGGVIRVSFRPRWLLVLIGLVLGAALARYSWTILGGSAGGNGSAILEVGWTGLWCVLSGLGGLIVSTKRVPSPR